jgi:hypothetical protein
VSERVATWLGFWGVAGICASLVGALIDGRSDERCCGMGTELTSGVYAFIAVLSAFLALALGVVLARPSTEDEGKPREERGA